MMNDYVSDEEYPPSFVPNKYLNNNTTTTNNSNNQVIIHEFSIAQQSQNVKM